ncbi:MAG: hypothetical protein A3G81_07815 [Betaproteobacteria bacterium RIFCSPLOWO2_12_FULL_65_14]|nr:MAG: hypothetical protein A3G81_07815 [Betaproteobacteria bacterium RIFCSPLOWO2_12_FULL_65_14]
MTDFQPVTLVAAITFALVVHPDVGANTVQELIALARSQPGKLNYVSIGAGSQHHLGMELFKATTGVDLVHVPYKGSAQYLPDLLSGRVAVIFTGLPPVLRHIQAGKLRALAVGSKQRSSALPDVPTVAESGMPGFEMSAWFGILGL